MQEQGGCLILCLKRLIACHEWPQLLGWSRPPPKVVVFLLKMREPGAKSVVIVSLIWRISMPVVEITQPAAATADLAHPDRDLAAVIPFAEDKRGLADHDRAR